MWPGGPLLSTAVVRPLHLLCFGQRAYLYRGAGLGHAGLASALEIHSLGINLPSSSPLRAISWAFKVTRKHVAHCSRQIRALQKAPRLLRNVQDLLLDYMQ